MPVREISKSQIKAARVLLGWSRSKLADISGIPEDAVRQFENEAVPDDVRMIQAMRDVLEAAGIEFLAENGGGAGLRLKQRRIPVDEGMRPDQLDASNDD